MTRIEKLAINDYIEEPTKLNFELVLRTFNAPLEINTVGAKKILDAYVKTKDKTRLKQFQELLKSPNAKIVKKEIKYKTEDVPKNEEYKALDKELFNLLKTNRSESSHNPDVVAKIKKLKNRMNELALELGITTIDLKPSRELAQRFDKEVVKAIFGNLENKDSLVSQMFAGNIQTHTFRANSYGANMECLNFNKMINQFETIYGKRLPHNYVVEKVWNKGNTGFRLELTRTLNPTYKRQWENGSAIETIG